ncbi:MAG: HNH endonuclease [Verrucomicrobia bacterium]|nr:HNH endonuclease [Verrucomicrobiota bacterium]
MRPLPQRPVLPNTTQAKLKTATSRICRSADQKSTAAKVFRAARRTGWFAPVVRALGRMTGEGQPCMFCDSNEASDVDHFRPKAMFPQLALTWENFLWTCGVCNRAKGDSFPQDTQGRLINPVDENAWDFFFLDEFGNLTPLWRQAEQQLDRRAVSTCDLLKLNRQTLQQRRHRRLRQLHRSVLDVLELHRTNRIKLTELRQRVEAWRTEPFQADVADYFLRGPGHSQSPFAELIRLL